MSEQREKCKECTGEAWRSGLCASHWYAADEALSAARDAVIAAALTWGDSTEEVADDRVDVLAAAVAALRALLEQGNG